MLQLLIGLVLFLGVHSLQSLAPELRQVAHQRVGALIYKAVYASMAGVGLYLTVQGYGLARVEPIVIWTPPSGMTHATLLLMWLAMVLLIASYVPHNLFKAKVRHPMTLSVKVWALAHLLSNGNLADMLLFGSFLVWSVVVFRAARRRDRLQSPFEPETTVFANALTLLIGTAVWGAFVIGGVHAWLIGVNPLS